MHVMQLFSIMMIGLYLGVVFFLLVLAWRGVKAHERLAVSVERSVENMKRYEESKGKDNNESVCE
ncbi:hypothetical protein [Melghirimyces algeriensis]|uniref:Uncharacterized protein n=1 Tax=Melghirimyces algeriensis TaxID=910412 RepID=A0A521BHD3_9BACL|nr:hypothetical protein [Melghirimyces algeriensis]SMO46482.1 hypothetical protein SAMN06264849_10292 [Melghirimyces algeriensis]